MQTDAAGSGSAFTPDWDRFPALPADVANVRIARVSSGRTLHRFFDTSPFSPSGRYLGLFRLPHEDRTPAPGEAGEVILVNLSSGEERVVASSRGYEMQLGANVQWGASDAELFFNDVDPATWEAFAVQLDPLTGRSRRLGGTVFMASPDGRQLASYNLAASRRAQVGYGVVVPEPSMPPRNIGPVESDGVYVTDVASGECRCLVTVRDVYEQSRPSLAVAGPEDYEYAFFQVKWNPQGTRLLTTLQWRRKDDPNGPRQRAVVTMRPDGSDLRTAITPAQWARGGHHINWMPDGEHLSMNLCVEGNPGLAIISVRADGTDLRVLYSPGSGHPSMQPHGLPWMVTDAYPDEPVAAQDGTSPLRLIDLRHGTERTLINIFVSMTGGEFRVDPHPVWDRSGRLVAFNGFVGNTRSVYVADLSAVVGN